MKHRKKAYLMLIILAACIYVALLLILFFSESSQPDSSIQTIGDAFWYSLVTLTTVGYGDVTPNTPLGHMVGIIFLLLSAGIMVTLFGTVVQFLAGEALPMLYLRRHKAKDWYYFADYEQESRTLAANIVKENPEVVIIFGEKKDDHNEMPDFPCLFLNTSLHKIVAMKKDAGTQCKVFLMKENDIGKNSRAIDIAELPVTVYARTTNGRDSLSGNIHFFHSYDCCARAYWRAKPLRFDEKNIAILGFGHYGTALLERAILTNVISLDQNVAYHVFGDPTEFLNIHYCLDEMFSINQVSEEKDSILFYTEEWSKYHTILEQADRIIICLDDEIKGWEIYWKILNYYKIRGKIDLRSSRNIAGVSFFGSNNEIYTPSHVMRTGLNKAAITINELFRQSVSYPTKSWDELDDFHRQSKIAAADHLYSKVRILLKDDTITTLDYRNIHNAYRRYRDTIHRKKDRDFYRQLDHIRWCRFYYYYNWQYGERRDELKREHPMLVSYSKLTEAQKIERDSAWELMNNISVTYQSLTYDEDD